MSGGHFQYQQYRIEDIAVEIDELIESNDDETLDQYGGKCGHGYPPEVIEKFREAVHTLRQAAEMAQRVDWLVSGDDGEDSFMRRWGKEVRPYWHNVKGVAPLLATPNSERCYTTRSSAHGSGYVPLSNPERFEMTLAEAEADVLHWQLFADTVGGDAIIIRDPNAYSGDSP